MDREPTGYRLSIGEDANHELFEVIGTYDIQGVALNIIPQYTKRGYRVKIEYIYDNGVIEFRIVEGGHRANIRQSSPGTTPPPVNPPPPAALVWNADFSKSHTGGYYPLII